MKRRGFLLVLTMLGASTSAAADRHPPRHWAGHWAGALLVIGPQAGFVVSSSGLAVTTSSPALPLHAVVAVGLAGRVATAEVILVEGRLTILRLLGVDVVDAIAVAAADKALPGASAFLTGLLPHQDAQGRLTSVEAVVGSQTGSAGRLLVPVPRGAPVVDADGQVVYVCVAERGAGVIEVVDVRALWAVLIKLKPGPTSTAAAPH